MKPETRPADCAALRATSRVNDPAVAKSNPLNYLLFSLSIRSPLALRNILDPSLIIYTGLYELSMIITAATIHLVMKKALRETQQRAGCCKAEPNIFAPAQTPFPWVRDGPKFNKLEMVTTVYLQTQFGKIDGRNFEFS